MNQIVRNGLTAIAVGVAWFAARQASAGDAQPVTFEHDVRPILKANCFQCHGEAKELAGGLDLRLRHTIVAGGDSGPAVEPGDRAASLLFDYVQSGMMPPKEEQQLKAQEIAWIGRWIDAKAPTLTPEPASIPKPGAFVITAEERSHWAFQPIRRPPLPNIASESHASSNPIDAFIAQRLATKGLTFSPPADRLTLIRRATFDLLGLPPAPQDVDAFLSDTSPQAYENLIDRLLASPHYGERWGRHWLDAAGYADSEGYDDADAIRPDAWLYRDYVIASLDSDKPWDQFIIEQLAGDELVRATHANAQGLANQDRDAREKLTATGFLRMAPDGTGSRPMDPEAAKHEVVTETVKIVSSSLLGMTVGCAQCHHHRYDPIPQEDFYRLRAILAPVFDTENWRAPNARRVALLSETDKAKADELEAQAKQLDAEHDRIKEAVLQIILQRVLERIPDDQRQFARQAFETDARRRTAEQEQFVQDQYPMLALLRAGTLHLFLARYKDGAKLQKEYEDIQAAAAKIRSQKPAPQFMRVVTEDVKHVPTTHVFDRGDFTAPSKEVIPPGGLTVLSDRFDEQSQRPIDQPNVANANAAGELSNTFADDDPDLPTTGRRLAYARYLTSGKHPLLARVLVNRFWMHHYGRGIVESTGDFGSQGSPPSHPELLDWLAADFMEQGWKLKRLHKLIMTSRTYMQASQRRPEAEAIDADNRLLWRMPVRRLEAETIRDAILAVCGQLNREPFGEPVPVATNEGGIVTVAGSQSSQDRRACKRSIYVQVRRSQPVAMLEVFDAPQMEPNCDCRLSSTVATQSLAMLNGDFAVRHAEAFADHVLAELGESSSAQEQIARAWKLAFGGEPSSQEYHALKAFLDAQTDDFQVRRVKNAERQALASLCQVLFGSNHFLYVD